MSQIVIAKRYARALTNLIDKEKELESVLQSLTDLAEAFQSSSDLQKLLVNTKVSLDDKTKVIIQILEKMKAPPLVQTFMRYLLAKRRIMLLPEIEQAFSQLVMEKLGKLEADVTVAEELSKSNLKELEEKISSYSGKTVSVTQHTDPSILGGIITRIGSVVIDGSIRNQLTRVRQSIIRG